VLLAAGQGKRLRPITDAVAKPLVPLLNVPLLYWMTGALLRAGARHLVANVHVHEEQLRAAAARLGDGGVELRLVREPRLTGPAGGLAACRDALPGAPAYLVVSGDAVTDQDLGDLVEAHRAWESDLTIMSRPVAEPGRFGVLRLNGDRVTGYAPNPAAAAPGAPVSCGIYVLSDRALAALDPAQDAEYDFKHVVPALLAAGMRVHAYRSRAYWNDVGEPAALLEANLSRLRPAHLAAVARPADEAGSWVQDDGARPLQDDGARPLQDDGARPLEGGGAGGARGAFTMRRSLVGRQASIGTRADLDRCVIGAGARVGAGARLRDCLVLPEAVVPAGAALTRQVLS
jgi:NDP-sugar pyrophosphorylase family protein